jgi:hypothetical protein
MYIYKETKDYISLEFIPVVKYRCVSVYGVKIEKEVLNRKMGLEDL